ncbi:MAG TPA: membrane protein insertion efficiency factor YidD [Terriglobia bacterium]|nr:membrane protein insertion efficiency factor YidD [Terriglobia bacterium]
MKRAALGLIRFYQVSLAPALAPVLMPSMCRFTPSCSAFAYEAIEKWGVRRGMGLSLRRLIRCRPLGGCGYDPVP